LTLFCNCSVVWRAWLHPWTEPVPAGWRTTPHGGVHPATASRVYILLPVQSTTCLYIKCYVFSNKQVLSQLLSLLLSLLPVHSGDPEFVQFVSFLLHTHALHPVNTCPCSYRPFFVAVLCLLLLLTVLCMCSSRSFLDFVPS
jgi:hypothetical protein